MKTEQIKKIISIFGGNFNTDLVEFVPEQIWVKSTPLRFFGLQIGTRMTVIKLKNNSLFIHSPIGLNEYTMQQLDDLGSVDYIVSPNNMHHFFIGDYFDAYPSAKIYASPGLSEKRKDLSFKHKLREIPEPEWQDDLDQFIFLGHKNLREVIFYHYKSRTLILTDLLMNFTEDSAFLTKLISRFVGMYNKPTPIIDLKLSQNQMYQIQLSLERILQWDFNKIILAHGQLIEKDGKRIFREAFSDIIKSV